MRNCACCQRRPSRCSRHHRSNLGLIPVRRPLAPPATHNTLERDGGCTNSPSSSRGRLELEARSSDHALDIQRSSDGSLCRTELRAGVPGCSSRRCSSDGSLISRLEEDGIRTRIAGTSYDETKKFLRNISSIQYL